MWGQTIADPFTLVKQTVPVEQDVDVVQQLEKELRAEKKAQVETSTAQMGGSSGVELPDLPGQNNYLIRKAKKYAVEDDIPWWTISILGDFSALLAQQSMAAEQSKFTPISQLGKPSAIAHNQVMAMAFSTLHNNQNTAQKIVESQTAYNLAASSFGLRDMERKALKTARKRNKLDNDSLYLKKSHTTPL